MAAQLLPPCICRPYFDCADAEGRAVCISTVLELFQRLALHRFALAVLFILSSRSLLEQAAEKCSSAPVFQKTILGLVMNDQTIAGVEQRARPSQQEVEEAIRVLIRWTGDDPAREGLVDTPARVARAYREFFSGYQQDPVQILTRTFS